MKAFSNAPAPEALLSTARESLKSVLCDPQSDHSYTILMTMNAMGIVSRAMGAEQPAPVRTGMDDRRLAAWLREADATSIMDPGLMDDLRRHLGSKLAISNPRFRSELPGDEA